jgi:hypothetical protein
MGWDKGTGLGAKSQGRTTHIEVAQMSGRAGLGSRPATGDIAPPADDDPFGKQNNGPGNKNLPPNFKIQKHEADTRNYPSQQKIIYISCRAPIVDTASLYKIYTKDVSRSLLIVFDSNNIAKHRKLSQMTIILDFATDNYCRRF